MRQYQSQIGTVLVTMLAIVAGIVGVSLWRGADAPVGETNLGSTSPAEQSSGAREVDSVTMIGVYGDSLSANSSVAFTPGGLGPRAWPYYLPGSGYGLAGGAAQGGVSSAEILERINPLRSAATVVFLGTNDLQDEVPFAEFARNIRTLHARTEAASTPSRFVVVTVGPNNDKITTGKVRAWNASLRQLAESEGWSVADPWTGLRAANNRWVKGKTFDGLHPTERGAKILAENMVSELSAVGI